MDQISKELITPIIFEDLEPIEVPITLGRSDKPTHVLREGDSGTVSGFHARRLSGIRMDPATGEPVGISGNVELDIYLVSRCLYHLIEPGNLHGPRARVTEDEVRAFRPNVTAALFERAQDITPGLITTASEEQLERQLTRTRERLNRLRAIKQLPGDEEHAKNSSGATAGSSA